MTSFIKSLYYLLFIVIIFSCNKVKNNQVNYKNSLIIKDSIRIPINENEFYLSTNSYVKNISGKDYIFRVDYRNTSLDVYDWNTKNKIKKIVYKKEGANKINRFKGALMYPFDLDSILFATLNGQIYFTKNDSVLFSKKYKYKGFIPQFHRLYADEPVLFNNTLFLSSASPYNITSKKYFDRPLIYSYNLKEKNIDALPIKYPLYFKEYRWSREHLKANFLINKDNNLVVTYANTDSIYIYSINNFKLINKKSVKSRFIKKIDPYTGNYNSRDEYDYYVVHQGRYLTMLFDKYKNRYYRINILPATEKKVQRGYFKNVPFSIMVLDENFNILTERKFNKNEYSVIDNFITKEGLWISNNNSLRPNFNENELSFTLLTLDND